MDMKSAAGGGGDCADAPLVVLPGLICDGRMFAGQVEALGATVIDGFYDGADSIGAMADHALAHMPARCSLLGHSMGGRIALEIWRRAPQRVARLALADTGVHAVRAGESAARHALRDLGLTDGAAALVDAWLPPMVGVRGRADAALMAGLRAMAMDAGVAVVAAQTRALLARPDALAVLSTITVPTLVVTGGEDGWAPPAQHEAIAAAVPGARLVVVPGAGHMLPAEAPEDFNAILRDWLSWPSPRTGSQDVEEGMTAHG